MNRLMSIVLIFLFSAVQVIGFSVSETPSAKETKDNFVKKNEGTGLPKTKEIKSKDGGNKKESDSKSSLIQESTNSEQDSYVDNNKSVLVNCLPYVSLAFNALCVVLIIWLFMIINGYEDRFEQLEKNIDKEIKEIKNWHRKEAQKQIGEQLSPPISQSDLNIAFNNGIPYSLKLYFENEILVIIKSYLEKYLIKTNKQSSINEETRATSLRNDKKMLYASQWSSSNNSFYSVLEMPNESTVYELEVTGDNANFALYSGAIQKVINAPDFLADASDLQMKTNYHKATIARTESKGLAKRNTNGNWRIESKAIIIFE